MTSNYLPWLALLAIVVISLVFKGYVRLPSFNRPASTPTLGQTVGTVSHSTLAENLDSYTLGLAFAKAKRAEVEHEIAHLFAIQAGDKMKAAFAAPFSEPAPAGPATPPASAPQ